MNNEYFVELFEQRLAEYTGAPHVVVVDRCTNAMVLCLEYISGGVSRETWGRLTIPSHTYVSVPMTLLNYGYQIRLSDIEWNSFYQIGDSGVYDCAVHFTQGMYQPGTYQCISFQQKKRLAIGKGGAILLDDANAAAQLRRMRHDGRDSALSVHCDLANIIRGYHMNMTPDEAAKGILLINQQLPPYVVKGYQDYPDISQIPCLQEHV